VDTAKAKAWGVLRAPHSTDVESPPPPPRVGMSIHPESPPPPRAGTSIYPEGTRQVMLRFRFECLFSMILLQGCEGG